MRHKFFWRMFKKSINSIGTFLIGLILLIGQGGHAVAVRTFFAGAVVQPWMRLMRAVKSSHDTPIVSKQLLVFAVEKVPGDEISLSSWSYYPCPQARASSQEWSSQSFLDIPWIQNSVTLDTNSVTLDTLQRPL